jgi:hypothetical protein
MVAKRLLNNEKIYAVKDPDEMDVSVHQKMERNEDVIAALFATKTA